MSFLIDRIRHWANRHPGRVALRDGSEALTYAELDRISAEFAEVFRPLPAPAMVGVGVGHGVVGAVAIVSLLRAGHVGIVMSDRREPVAELEVRLSKYPFSAVLTDAHHPLRTLFKGHETTKRGLSVIARETRADLGDARWALLTSGTTGESKAVLMSEDNLLARTEGEIELFGLGQGQVILNYLSFSHDLGLNQLLSVLAAGGELRINPMLSQHDMARALGEVEGVTGTPFLWLELIASARDGLDLSKARPRYLTVSGGALSWARLEELQASFPNSEVLRTYGQTETFRSLFARGLSRRGLGACVPGVSVRLSEEGELIHFGAGTMSGYLGDKKREKFTEDGGIRTGDYFSLDSDGDYQFQGRRDDLVKRSDYRVSLFEIEQVVKTAPGVRDAACLQIVAKSHTGGDIVAFVEAPIGSEPGILSYCRANLARQKVPDAVVRVDSFPRTAIGKVDRVALKKQFSSGEGP